MKNQLTKQVIKISSSSAAYLSDWSIKRFLPDKHSTESSKLEERKGDSVISMVSKLGMKIETLAQDIREHFRLAPKLMETVKGKLNLGARILQVGGVEKVFKQLFTVADDEKLLKACQCYLSTTSGPIAGLLFISTDKLAFCSERSIKVLSPTGKLLKIYYKVMIPLGKIKRADACGNDNIQSQKYMEVVTDDNFEFWFMGLLNHQKTMKCLQHLIS